LKGWAVAGMAHNISKAKTHAKTPVDLLMPPPKARGLAGPQFNCPDRFRTAGRVKL
jgi:hypothetical protein